MAGRHGEPEPEGGQASAKRRSLPLQSSLQPGTGTPPRGPGTCSRPGQAGQPGTGPTSSWKRPADRSYLHRLVAYSGILESRRRRNPSEQYCIADGQFKLTREKLSRERFESIQAGKILHWQDTDRLHRPTRKAEQPSESPSGRGRPHRLGDDWTARQTIGTGSGFVTKSLPNKYVYEVQDTTPIYSPNPREGTKQVLPTQQRSPARHTQLAGKGVA